MKVDLLQSEVLKRQRYSAPLLVEVSAYCLALVLNMKSPVFGIALTMAIVLGDTLMILGMLPLTGWLIHMVKDFSSTSVHWSFTASAVLALVSFNTCKNVAVFLPQRAMS